MVEFLVNVPNHKKEKLRMKATNIKDLNNFGPRSPARTRVRQGKGKSPETVLVTRTDGNTGFEPKASHELPQPIKTRASSVKHAEVKLALHSRQEPPKSYRFGDYRAK